MNHSFTFREPANQGRYNSAVVDLLREFATEGMVVAEIGTYDGITTCELLPIVQSFNGKYIAVDWFLGTKNPGWENTNHPHWHDPNQGDDTYERFVNNIKAGGWEGMTTVIRSDSAEAASQIPDRSLDVCFIDVDHRYSPMVETIELYLPKVKDGGLLVFDDCERHGVLRSEPDHLAKAQEISGNNLENDYRQGAHWGVIQAVCDVFDHSVNITLDTGWIVLDDKAATNERYLEIRKLT